MKPRFSEINNSYKSFNTSKVRWHTHTMSPSDALHEKLKMFQTNLWLQSVLVFPNVDSVLKPCIVGRSSLRITTTVLQERKLQWNYLQRPIIVFIIWASSSNHCLATLDFGSGVEQPFNCLIVQNSQAVQFLGRKIDRARTIMIMKNVKCMVRCSYKQLYPTD